MSGVPAEQREEWRYDATYTTQPDGPWHLQERILALLDALDAAEKERDALVAAPFRCVTHMCGSCGGCKAAKVRDLLSEAQGELARLRPLHTRLTERWQQAEAIAVSEHDARERAEAAVARVQVISDHLASRGCDSSDVTHPHDPGSYRSAVCPECLSVDLDAALAVGAGQ